MKIKDLLLHIAPTVVVKLSPMADIKLNLKLLPNTTAVHIVSVENETLDGTNKNELVYRGSGNSEWVNLEDVSPYFIDAIIISLKEWRMI